MALITCPECKKEVSDKASSCPSCGCPIHSDKKTTQTLNSHPQQDRVQTIQETSKKWKTFQLLGGISIVIGIVCLIASSSSGSGTGAGFSGFFFFIGLGALIYGAVGSWWHHR